MHLLFKLFNALVGFLEGLVEFIIDEDVVLVGVLQVLNLFLKVFHVDATFLNLFI